MKLSTVQRYRAAGASTTPGSLPLGLAVTCCVLSGPKPKVSINHGDIVDDPRAFVTYSVHPKHTMSANTPKKRNDYAAMLIDHSVLKGVVAVGEIGLDYLHAKYNRQQIAQRETLTVVLSEVRKRAELTDLPLVLHVRGKSPVDLSASQDCIRVLKEAGVPSEHPIYRHCFVGGLQEARMWLKAFPNCKFGFSPKVPAGQAHAECPIVFMHLDLDQILVETDAPYLPLPCSDRMVTPWSTFYLFQWLAALRSISFGDVLKQVESNCRQFYGITAQ